MNARAIVEAESPKGILHAAREQARSEYSPSEREQDIIGARSSRVKLQRERFEAIKALRDQGLTFQQIGQHYNISANMARTHYLRGMRLMQRQPETPEEQLSNRAVNWLSWVLGIKLRDEEGNNRQWGSDAARALASKSARELSGLRNLGPKLYTELRHWAITNYGVKLPSPEEFVAVGSSAYKSLLPRVPRVPEYEI